jgi:hypothetical protein
MNNIIKKSFPFKYVQYIKKHIENTDKINIALIIPCKQLKRYSVMDRYIVYYFGF